MKKYKLIKDKDSELKRVIAIISIPKCGITKGEIGGLIESEKNLSHDGNAWVFGNARVSGDAQVSGNAWVSGNARVSGNAWVYGDALVYGDAQVFGNARVSGDAQVSGNARVSGNAWNKSPLYIQGSLYALTNCKYGYVRIGCEEHSIKEWIKDGKRIAEKHGFTKEQIAEYAEYIKLFKKIGK
jgi:hypothetical protein